MLVREHRQLLLVLAEHAADPAEKACLLRLASLDGVEQYAQTVVAEQRNLLEVLQQYGERDRERCSAMMSVLTLRHPSLWQGASISV